MNRSVVQHNDAARSRIRSTMWQDMVKEKVFKMSGREGAGVNGEIDNTININGGEQIEAGAAQESAVSDCATTNQRIAVSRNDSTVVRACFVDEHELAQVCDH